MGCPALELAGCWVELGLSIERLRSLGELSLIDITWGREVSGGAMSWTWLSHLRDSGLTPDQSTKTLSATRLPWVMCTVSRWSQHHSALSGLPPWSSSNDEGSSYLFLSLKSSLTCFFMKFKGKIWWCNSVFKIFYLYFIFI